MDSTVVITTVLAASCPSPPMAWAMGKLLTAVGALGQGAPFKECLTHGWTVDGEGKAMHKSLGNGMDPNQLIKEYGADIVLHAAFPSGGAEQFASRLTELSAGQLAMTAAGESFLPGPREAAR